MRLADVFYSKHFDELEKEQQEVVLALLNM